MAIPDLSQRFERTEEPVPFIENEEELAREPGNFEHFRQSDEYAEKRALGATDLSLRNSWQQRDKPMPSIQPQIAATVNGIDITEMSGANEGPDGVHTISTGRGDPGGVSYGKHQLMSKRSSGQTDSTMDKFLASDYADLYKEDFKGLTPGTPEFSEVYTKLANEDEANFEDAQTQFILDTHYEPLRVWADNKGFDTEDPGIASALYSISVQHGGWQRFLKGVDTSNDPTQVIKDIYTARTSYVNGIKNMEEQTKKNIAGRYRRETQEAITISNNKTTDQNDNPILGPFNPPDEAAIGPRQAPVGAPPEESIPSLNGPIQAPPAINIPDELNQRL